MQIIDRIYVDGAFVEPHGSELFDLFDPATCELIDAFVWPTRWTSTLPSPRPGAHSLPWPPHRNPNASRC